MTEPAVGRLDVGVGQPGVDRPHRHLHRERGEEGQPQPALPGERQVELLHRRRKVRGADLPVDGDDGQQHQHRAEQRVEEELEGGVDAPLAAPHADDQEHRDEDAFEEDVEQRQVERAEHADHEGLEHEERDHVFLDANLDRFPARQDADRRQQGRQQHEEQRDAVDAGVVADVERRHPGDLLLELEARLGRVEAHPEQQRDQEGHRRRDDRNAAAVAVDGLLGAADDQAEQRAYQGQERDQGKDRPARHRGLTSPTA